MSCPKCDSTSVSMATTVDQWLTCAGCGHHYIRRVSRYERLMSDHPGYDPISPIKPGDPRPQTLCVTVESTAASTGWFTIPIQTTGSNIGSDGE